MAEDSRKAAAAPPKQNVSTETVKHLLSTGKDEDLGELLRLLVNNYEPEKHAPFANDILKSLHDKIPAMKKRLSPTPWSPDYTNLQRCDNISDVQALVKQCRISKRVVRVAGAQHSTPQAVFASSTEKAVKIKLEGTLRLVEWISEDPSSQTAIVRVGAGSNLGIDPTDSNSTPENSFTRQLDARGYALPILGGMSHQTVGGFLSTSTAGGSLRYGIAETVQAIELVDGLGEVRTLNVGTDELNAAAVSMGLFGILTRVTFRVQKKYLVKGIEATVRRSDSMLKDGSAFKQAFQSDQYVHSVWFAAQFVDSVLEFKANQAPDTPTEKIVPYKHPLKQWYMNYLTAVVLLCNAWLTEKDWPKAAALLFNLLQPVSKGQSFNDHWYIALPNDDEAMIDQVIRVQFTEIWIDVDESEQVLQKLTDLFKVDPAAAGNFGVELYAAKRSPFWMSMSYERDCIRIDPYWFEYNRIGTLDDYFEKFWKVLLPFKSARLHWGKHWPAVGRVYGDRTIGPADVAKSYPKFEQWKGLRQTFDPENVFVTKYWDDTLGLIHPA